MRLGTLDPPRSTCTCSCIITSSKRVLRTNLSSYLPPTSFHSLLPSLLCLFPSLSPSHLSLELPFSPPLCFHPSFLPSPPPHPLILGQIILFLPPCLPAFIPSFLPPFPFPPLLPPSLPSVPPSFLFSFSPPFSSLPFSPSPPPFVPLTSLLLPFLSFFLLHFIYVFSYFFCSFCVSASTRRSYFSSPSSSVPCSFYKSGNVFKVLSLLALLIKLFLKNLLL